MDRVFSVKSSGEGKFLTLLNNGKNTDQIRELLASSKNFDSSKVEVFVNSHVMYFFYFKVIDIVKRLLDSDKVIGVTSSVLFLGTDLGRISKEIERVRKNMSEKKFVSSAPLDVRYYGDERVR